MSKKDFIEGVDFYLEGEFVVFTEIYLKKRGYCCKKSCRHCAYKKNNAAFVPPELLTVPPYDADGFISSKKKEE